MFHKPRFSYSGGAVIALGIALLGCESAMNPQSEKPINEQDALEIARTTLGESSDDHDFVIMEDKTTEREFGWVFFYDTKEFVDTGNLDVSVPGNGPLIVHRADGRTVFLSTSVPPQVAIDEYEKSWREQQAGN